MGYEAHTFTGMCFLHSPDFLLKNLQKYLDI
jgi:hypothetical protein